MCRHPKHATVEPSVVCIASAAFLLSDGIEQQCCVVQRSSCEQLCSVQELRQRIRDSYEARWKAEKHFDEDQILNEMPGSLRIEVSVPCCATTALMNRYGSQIYLLSCIYAQNP